MEVHFTTEQETQLVQLAPKAGIPADQLVKETNLRLSRMSLDAGRTGKTALYVTSQVLCEIYSAVTAISVAFRSREPWLTPQRTYSHFFSPALPARPVTGGAVFDLQLAAATPANEVRRIYTHHTSDFEGLRELAVTEPQIELDPHP
jgi:hypothetical protein